MAANITAASVYLDPWSGLGLKDLSSNILSLFIYSLGVAVYAFVVFQFYKNLGKRAIFDADLYTLKSYGFFHKILSFIHFLIKSLVIFPFISTVWFLILGGFLLLLSKSQDVSQILLMSMTIITASRITAYYDEDLSKDVAKLVPFALLGVFIVDPTFFTVADTLQKLYSVPMYLHVIIQYIIAIVILEFVLRSFHKVRMKVSSD